MSENITHAPRARRIDLQSLQVLSRLWRGSIRIGKSIARGTWAVLRSLGILAFTLGLIAGGGALLWHQGGALTSNDATIQRKIISEENRDPFPGNCRSPRTVDSERSDALAGFIFGGVMLLGGGGGVIFWCGETRNALFRRRYGKPVNFVS